MHIYGYICEAIVSSAGLLALLEHNVGSHSTRPLEIIPDWGTRSSTPADRYLVYPYIGGSKLKRRIYGWSGASIVSSAGLVDHLGPMSAMFHYGDMCVWSGGSVSRRHSSAT
jgi:hypothetical protein